MQIRNTNPSFGDTGPFEAASIDAMVADAALSFLRDSARDIAAQPDAEETEAQALDRLADEFRDGLEVVTPDSEREIDTLYDSDTNEELTADDLGISEERYEELVAKSAAQGEGHAGHVVIGETGRRVYASY